MTLLSKRKAIILPVSAILSKLILPFFLFLFIYLFFLLILLAGHLFKGTLDIKRAMLCLFNAPHSGYSAQVQVHNFTYFLKIHRAISRTIKLYVGLCTLLNVHYMQNLNVAMNFEFEEMFKRDDFFLAFHIHSTSMRKWLICEIYMFIFFSH